MHRAPCAVPCLNADTQNDVKSLRPSSLRKPNTSLPAQLFPLHLRYVQRRKARCHRTLGNQCCIQQLASTISQPALNQDLITECQNIRKIHAIHGRAAAKPTAGRKGMHPSNRGIRRARSPFEHAHLQQRQSGGATSLGQPLTALGS